MTTAKKKSVWLKCRRVFRWCRQLFALLILAVVCVFIYLNQVGLPAGVKTRLLAELRARGLDVEFSRLRLEWYRGIVAEKIVVGRVDQPKGPRGTIETAEVRLDSEALKKYQIKVTSVFLTNGSLTWPLFVTNQPSQELKIDHLTTELRFLPGDAWELDHFRADCLGINVQARGIISNALALRGRSAPRAVAPRERTMEGSLHRLVTVVNSLRFDNPPSIDLVFRADASTNGMISARFKGSVSGAHTPWGDGQEVQLDAQWDQAAGSNGLAQADIKLAADGFTTTWVESRQFQLTAKVSQPRNDLTDLKIVWVAGAQNVKSRWGEADGVQLSGVTTRDPRNQLLFQTELGAKLDSLKVATASANGTNEWGQSELAMLNAELRHTFTNAVPADANFKLRLTKPLTRWGKVTDARLEGHFAPRDPDSPRNDIATWGAWAKLEPYSFDWECEVTDLDSPKLIVEKLFCSGRWNAPDLTLTKLQARLYEGQVDMAAQLNVATRAVGVQGGFDFDVHKIGPLLNTNGQQWLSQYSWEKPIKVEGEARVTLPVWTNASPDWRAEVLPTLWVKGKFDSGPGAFRNIACLSGRSDFTFSNAVWKLPNLTLHRPEGSAVLSYSSDILSQQYYWGIRSQLDPNTVAPFLNEGTRKALAYFEFTSPPFIDGELRGRWHELDQIGFKGRVSLTNFIFRGEGCSNFSAYVDFTNRLIQFSDITIAQGQQAITSPSIIIDLEQQSISSTNVFSTIDPMIVARAIGPKTAKTISYYKFATPPTIQSHGSMMFKDIEHTDLHFQVEGGPFNCLKFNSSHITGGVHWVTNTLNITNVQGNFYDGQLQGNLLLNFSPETGNDFRAHAIFSSVNLHSLVADLANPTNKLEGILDGTLTITNANTADWKSWNGYGDVSLRDGLLWDAPLFGLFSPILNGVSPGLGSSRAKEATATFGMTNSVMRTTDLEIRSTPVRLHYDGTVDFAGNVDAKVEAEMFGDTWVVGPVLKTMMKPFSKIFEYKVTGSVRQPRSRPMYIPKFLLFPLHPFRTLKELLPGSDNTTAPRAPKKQP